MKVEVAVGTANHRTTKVYSTASGGKSALLKHVADAREWASRYNHEADRKLTAIQLEVSEMNIPDLPVHDLRSWTVHDEHTGFTWVFWLKKLEN